MIESPPPGPAPAGDVPHPPPPPASAGRLGFTGADIPPGDVYDKCVRCGLCLPTCPTYVETLVETSSPRGRIALIKSVAEGYLDLTSPGFVHQMSECLDCRACEAVCPSGVEYGQLLEPARTQVQRSKGSSQPWHERLIRTATIGALFANMGLMRLVATLLRFYQRSGIQAALRGSGLLRALGLEKLEAMAPRVSRRFFVPRGQRWAALGRRKTTAFMHAGCVMHVAFADVDEATVRVLQRAGCDVLAPSDQGCCGAITIHAGDMDRGRALAKRNIAAFERSGADVYVINAAGCGSALKEYGHLFAADPQWHERAVAFSSRVRDVLELLDEIGISPELGPIDAVVTYQEPCHLAHAQRITAAPRRLLAQIPGLELREMRESSLCCGSAGIYNVTQPEMAERLGRRKIERIAEVVAADRRDRESRVRAADRQRAPRRRQPRRREAHRHPARRVVRELQVFDERRPAQRRFQRRIAFERTQQPGDPEQAQDLAFRDDERDAAALLLRPPLTADQGAQARRVDEFEPAEVDDHLVHAALERFDEGSAHGRRGRDVEGARQFDHLRTRFGRPHVDREVFAAGHPHSSSLVFAPLGDGAVLEAHHGAPGAFAPRIGRAFDRKSIHDCDQRSLTDEGVDVESPSGTIPKEPRPAFGDRLPSGDRFAPRLSIDAVRPEMCGREVGVARPPGREEPFERSPIHPRAVRAGRAAAPRRAKVALPARSMLPACCEC